MSTKGSNVADETADLRDFTATVDGVQENYLFMMPLLAHSNLVKKTFYG